MSTTVEKPTEKTAIWTIDASHSSVGFSIRHMMFTTVRGNFTRFAVDLNFEESGLERSSVEARIEAASINTRDEKRDEHLRSADFLSAEQYPYIVFTSRRVERLAGEVYRIVGDLTIRDVKREAVLDATFSGMGKSPWGTLVAGFSAEVRVSRKDYGLTWNVGLDAGGVLVGDDVKISLEIEAVKQG